MGGKEVPSTHPVFHSYVSSLFDWIWAQNKEAGKGEALEIECMLNCICESQNVFLWEKQESMYFIQIRPTREEIWHMHIWLYWKNIIMDV